MSNYTTDYLNHRLVTYSDSSTGQIISQDHFTEKRTKLTKSNKRGMSMFKKNDYLTMQEDTVRSLLDLKLWNFLVSSYKQSGVCMHNLKPVTITLLTEEFTVTRQKVSAFIKRGIEANFIRKQGTSLTLNPYVLVPFGISDEGLHELQSAWTNTKLTKDN